MSDIYAMGRTAKETRRLMLQHQVYGPLTRRVFQAAGIGSAMKVLDVGSGAGDVALLVADLVGPSGLVVGVDMNAEILETARERVAMTGLTHVAFLAGDISEVAPDVVFDAVVGRFVLMYIDDPVAVLRKVITRLRPGGIVCFHELDMTYPPTIFPVTDLAREFQRLMITPAPAGAEMHMGTKLLKTYVEAGLPVPQMMMEAAVGGGPDWLGYELLAQTFRSLIPSMQKSTGLDPKELDVDTLEERLRQDVLSRNGILMMPTMYGAWSHKPS